MMEGVVLGVDFGTCLSSAVVSRSDGSVLRVKDPVSLSFSMPSSVAVDKSGELIFGTAAERVKLTRPFASQFKRDLGGETPVMLGELRLTPVELVSQLVRWLRDQAEETAGHGAANLVVTIPASYEQHRRELMLKAAVGAGFDPAATVIIEEPVAAVAFALVDRPAEPGERLMIYDLGGGTFDVAVVEVTPDGFRVLSHDGAPDVGGLSFDRLIAADVLESVAGLAEALAADGDDLRSQARRQRRRLELAEFCRDLKHQLSAATHQEDWVPGTDEIYDLSRDRFAAMIAPLLAETLARCDAAVDAARLSWDQIDRAVMVGGSTRIPSVSALLSETRGQSVQRLSEPELAVAEGAALHLKPRKVTVDQKASGAWADFVAAHPPGTGVLSTVVGPDGDHVVMELGQHVTARLPRSAAVTNRDIGRRRMVEIDSVDPSSRTIIVRLPIDDTDSERKPPEMSTPIGLRRDGRTSRIGGSTGYGAEQGRMTDPMREIRVALEGNRLEEADRLSAALLLSVAGVQIIQTRDELERIPPTILAELDDLYVRHAGMRLRRRPFASNPKTSTIPGLWHTHLERRLKEMGKW